MTVLYIGLEEVEDCCLHAIVDGVLTCSCFYILNYALFKLSHIHIDTNKVQSNEILSETIN